MSTSRVMSVTCRKRDTTRRCNGSNTTAAPCTARLKHESLQQQINRATGPQLKSMSLMGPAHSLRLAQRTRCPALHATSHVHKVHFHAIDGATTFFFGGWRWGCVRAKPTVHDARPILFERFPATVTSKLHLPVCSLEHANTADAARPSWHVLARYTAVRERDHLNSRNRPHPHLFQGVYVGMTPADEDEAPHQHLAEQRNH